MSVAKIITVFIFLLSVTGSTFNKAIVLLDFQVNQKFIATELCENRIKPKCCCHGKCFLKKQLQKDEAEKNGPSVSKDKFDVQFFCEHSHEQFAVVACDTKLPIAYLIKKYNAPDTSVFRPPAM